MKRNDILLTTIGCFLGAALLINSVILYYELSVIFLITEMVIAVCFMAVFISLAGSEQKIRERVIIREIEYPEQYQEQDQNYPQVIRTKKELEEISKELDSLNRDISSLQTYVEIDSTQESEEKILDDINTLRKDIPKAPKATAKKKAKQITVRRTAVKKIASKPAKKIAAKKEEAKKSRKMSDETKKMIAWKMERRKKYSDSDTTKRPEAGTRSKFWVSGFKKADGTKVPGKWRKNHA